MATAVKSIIAQARQFLMEKKAKFWSDEELQDIFGNGVQDLWGAILDLHAEHYMIVTKDGQVSLKTNETQLSGVPEDCFRVLLIEPQDTTSDGTGRQVQFTPRKYNHADFRAARTRAASEPTAVYEIFYHVSGVGAPIQAPTILTAPKLSSDLALRLAYCPTITVGDINPVPGQSDNALKAWTLAYALAKEGPQGQRIPDAGWLQIYATEKQLILTRLTPRQEDEPEVVEDFFRGYGVI